ncbi:MAG: high frequency lysogenization protein HflD [Chromatiales bacterium]|jgi:high frequency lysogenization protein
MHYSDQDRTLALAGIYQAACLVQQIARRGVADSESMSSSVHSLFQIDADSVSEVFGGVAGVDYGLRQLSRQLGGEVKRDNEITGYLLNLVHLQRKLSSEPERMQKIQQGILQTKDRLTHFPELHPNILAALADIYVNFVSTLQPRIMVSGEPVYLHNPDNINRIRSLLLGGIRAAMLWWQTGGRRRQILFNRSRYVEQAKTLLQLAD